MARRILLADDSVTAQNMGRRILSDAGYEVITVNNGSAALKKVAEQPPDVIVLDVYMPGYGGLEVCQRLKEVPETARIPILLTVGKLEPFKPDEARRVRADAFIIKPFEATELLAALTKLEDKIVPQSDAPRGGKVRSITPEPGRGEVGRNEEDTGWKNRLSIPPGGKGRSPGGMEADDFGQQVPVEAAAPKTAASEEKPKPTLVPDQEKVAAVVVPAVEATAPIEVSQVQPSNVQEIAIVESKAAESSKEKEQEPAKENVTVIQPDAQALQPVTESKTESPVTTGERVSEEAPAAVASAIAGSNAAAVVESYSGPRWVAESVSLSADDTAFPLEREMEKSLAAGAAYNAGLEAAAAQKQGETKELVATSDSSTAANEPAASVPAAETKIAENSEASSEIKPEIKNAEIPVSAELPVIAAPAETQVIELVGEVVVPSRPEAYAAAASMGSAASESSAPETRTAAVAEDSVHTATGKQQLADAWEQWQNVRETVLSSPVTEQITEVAAASLKNALPVESFAKGPIDIEARETAAPSNPTAIASIVDSVLAELKPRLMEEIAKKMSNEKK